MGLLTESSTVDVLTILVGVFGLVFWFVKRTYTYWERRGFKVVPGKSYLFGHFRKTVLQKEFVGDEVKNLYNSTNEPFVGIYSVLKPILMIRDPELIRSVLVKDFAHFTDRGVHCDEDFDPLSGHLFALPGTISLSDGYVRKNNQSVSLFRSKMEKSTFKIDACFHFWQTQSNFYNSTWLRLYAAKLLG